MGWIDPNGLTPSQTLDRNLGGVVGDKMQAHHVIPVAVWGTHSKFLTVLGLGGNRDSASNGLLIPDSCQKAKSIRRLYYHCGSLAQYNAKVDAQIRVIKNQYENKLISASQAKNKVKNLQDDLRIYVSQSSSYSSFTLGRNYEKILCNVYFSRKKCIR